MEDEKASLASEQDVLQEEEEEGCVAFECEVSSASFLAFVVGSLDDQEGIFEEGILGDDA